jgi:alanine-glyoxylate transaminase/serine-glyoxylate transaminase/serine-pyruvate transaminase
MFETGWFSALWCKMATALGLQPEIISGDWRSGVRADQIADKLLADKEHRYKAVAVVHNETSTGVTSNIEAVRRAIDDAKHPALLLVDTISSLGSIDYRHDEWGVDVTICGSRRG